MGELEGAAPPCTSLPADSGPQGSAGLRLGTEERDDWAAAQLES